MSDATHHGADSPTTDDQYEDMEVWRTHFGEFLTFAHVSMINAARAGRWHHGFPNHNDGWTGADWANAMQGEAGEAGNVVKKLRRLDFNLQGNPDEEDRGALLAKLADEIADTFIYLDLLATFYGIDLPAAIRHKFNKVSEREGLPERLP